MAELKSQHPEVASQKIFLSKWAETGGLKSGKTDWFWMKFTFEDNEYGSKYVPGDSIAMNMEFQANQTEGQER